MSKLHATKSSSREAQQVDLRVLHSNLTGYVSAKFHRLRDCAEDIVQNGYLTFGPEKLNDLPESHIPWVFVAVFREGIAEIRRQDSVRRGGKEVKVSLDENPFLHEIIECGQLSPYQWLDLFEVLVEKFRPTLARREAVCFDIIMDSLMNNVPPRRLVKDLSERQRTTLESVAVRKAKMKTSDAMLSSQISRSSSDVRKKLISFFGSQNGFW